MSVTKRQGASIQPFGLLLEILDTVPRTGRIGGESLEILTLVAMVDK
jgi:hypothetical protein